MQLTKIERLIINRIEEYFLDFAKYVAFVPVFTHVLLGF